MNGKGCWDDMTLDFFRMGLLEAAEAEAVRSHVQGCPTCQARLGALDLEDLRLEAALALTREEADVLMAADLPDRLAAQVSGGRRGAWGLASGLVGLGLAAAAGLQGAVLPWLQGLPLGGWMSAGHWAPQLTSRLFRWARSLLWSPPESQLDILVPLLAAGLVIILLNLWQRRRGLSPFHH